MLDIDQELTRLRRRIAAVDERFRDRRANRVPAPPPAPSPSSSRSFIEQWAEGKVVANEFGEHFQCERLFPGDRRHGSADIGALSELPDSLLTGFGEQGVMSAPPSRWAFLDTETTGLAGGSGTYAFLIGVGRIAKDGFRVRQFFMREYMEESSQLAALEEHLQEFDVLVTYNGRSYDQPLLETRFRMTRRKPPFSRLGHLDLLYGARRLWKLRLDNCRLMQLEREILGVYREGDLAGELIPYVYFEYLRSKEAHQLVPIFHHNAMDILTLACLTALVPAAFKTTDPESLGRLGVRRGEELTGIARWLIAADEPERGLELLKRAVQTGLPDTLLFRTLWDIALLEKRQQRIAAALSVFTELAGCANDYRVPALEELAKFYEHEERNYALALAFTEQALAFAMSANLLHRKARLERRLKKGITRRLL